MTTHDDFDRRFAQFLEDGPTRSPERPVEQAVAHAQAHPRHRDPFAVLRRDPMARPSGWSSRPVMVFAVLGLLLVVSAAAFVVGSGNQPSIVPPLPTQSPIPSPTKVPTPSPDPTPRTFSATITDANGNEKSLTVIDESGLLENVFGGDPADPDRPQNAEIEAVQLGADEGGGLDGIVLHWVDISCGDNYRLTVDETARDLTLEAPACSGDAMNTNYFVWLDFSEPVPADEVTERIVRP